MAKGKKKNENPRFKGKFEPRVRDMLERAGGPRGFTVEYEPDTYSVSIPVTYTPDFVARRKGSNTKVIEAKGYFRYDDQRKVLAFKREYPGVDYYIVFQQDRPVRKGSKLTYLGWAKKHGITAAVGEIPEEWFE